ncbi:hypothetical protein GA840_06245 [Pediococcus ethanolidurans]|uniref:glycan biosynthesis hexose transferase WsfD n=1 Tax=Pediococcus ethanolidurans TaxID=319653 RepID=UPI0029542005|nr:hypothetical protein [Pediococcus ethanolidurans]MDV7719449.1 hypothetical protein [Pediococcus ethanolidurans]
MNISKLASKFKDYVSPALLAVILAAIISGILLFINPIHGLADNGDFYRAMLGNGIYRLPHPSNQYLSYVIPKFGIMKYFNENNVAVFSSQSLFIQLALVLNRLFYSRTIFDIRFLGVVYYVFYLGGIYLLTKSLVYPYKKMHSYVVALLVVVMFADSSFTLYFNSFFAEPGMLIAMLYAFGALMAIAHKCYQKNWPMVLLFFVSSIILITNKQQNAPLALSFMVITIGLFFLPQVRARKLLLGLGMLGILIAGGVTYALINTEFSTVNQYQAFTHGVLMETGDPSHKIAKGGISQQFALMRTDDYYPKTYAAVKPSGKLVTKKLTKRVGLAWVVRYYASNLKQFGQLLDVAAKDVMVTQVKAVGDYTKSSGVKPGAQVTYFTAFSAYMGAFFPGKFAFLCLLAIAFIAVYGVSFYLDLKSGKITGIIRFFLVLGLMTMVIFVPIISIIGDGDADLAKHLFMVPLNLDLVIIQFIADILHHRLWQSSTESRDWNEK